MNLPRQWKWVLPSVSKALPRKGLPRKLQDSDDGTIRVFEWRCEDSRLNQGYHSLQDLSIFIFYLKNDKCQDNRKLIPLSIPTLKWRSRDPKSYQFYTDQSCSKMVGHISQEYELTKKQTNKKGVFHNVSILERTTVRQKCSLVGLELEVATSC